MATQGNTTVNFGAFPGTAQVRLAITGQGSIAGTNCVEAWIRGEDSADHSAEEHGIEDFEIHALSISAGVGFTIVIRPRVGICYGIYNVSWVWN